jgi:hypothetical protein
MIKQIVLSIIATYTVSLPEKERVIIFMCIADAVLAVFAFTSHANTEGILGHDTIRYNAAFLLGVDLGIKHVSAVWIQAE